MTAQLDAFDYEKTYTLAQLRTYWDAMDGQYRVDHALIRAYVEMIGEVLKLDAVRGVALLKDTLMQIMDKAVSGKLEDDVLFYELDSLCDLLSDVQLHDKLTSDPDMQYARIAHACARVAGCGVLLESDNMFNLVQGSLNRMVAVLADKTDQGPLLVFDEHDPICAQLTRLFLPVAWCTLIEPSLKTPRDYIKSIWGERPPLLANEHNQDTTPRAVSLPDSSYQHGSH